MSLPSREFSLPALRIEANDALWTWSNNGAAIGMPERQKQSLT
jgi:hypothetical protein